MTRLSVTNSILVLIFCAFSSVVCAADNLYVFVFKNGEAQQNIKIVVGEQQALTNEFGLANFSLPGGEYEVGYYKDDELFALTEINLLEDQHSQIFLELTLTGAEYELDLPLSAYDQHFDHQEIKEQQGPKGELQLTLLDGRDDSPISDAKLFFRGYSVEGSSNEKGVANVTLSEGKYDISIIHPMYVMKVLRDVDINANTTTELETKLTKANIVLNEFIVSAPSVEGSLASTLTDLKDSAVFADAISAEQFSKSGDSSASGALKRVTGITVVGGKYVYIRGLGERYSTVLLNGMHIPSPEPTKRVVPLDIFPTGVIQNMNIQKTHSSDLPGTFAGGTVMITTKDIPKEDNYIKGSIGLSFNSSTGDTVRYNPDNSKGVPDILLGHSDNFGVLTEEVKLGDTVLAEGLTAEEKDELNRALVNYRSFGLKEKKLEPGKNLSLSLGQSFKTGSGLKYGVAGSLYYKTNEDSVHINKDEYLYGPSIDGALHSQEQSYDVASFKEKYGGMVSVGLDNLAGHQLKYTLLSLFESKESTNFGTKERLIEGTYHERTFLQYTEKDLIAHQFNGEHQLGKSQGRYFDDVIFSWGFETSEANRVEPGTFEYEYKETNDELVYDSKKTFFLYSDLQDEVKNYRLDFSLPFNYNKRENFTKFGYFNYQKSRDLDNRRFKFKYDNTLDNSSVDNILSETNIDNDTLDALDSYKPADFYTAKQDVKAFYVNQMISPLEKLDVVLGLRKETSTQELQVGQQDDDYSLDTSDLLPSLGLTWRLDDEQQIRFAYSSTISRPDFREFSPNRYKDPLTGDIIFGYENLKYTEISNVDIKYEWYPSYDESLSVAVFAKDFTNPIETVRTKADVDTEISYRNAESARSIGLELGFRKNLQNVWEGLKHYYVSGNYTIIDSTVSIGKDLPENQNDPFIQDLTTDDRPMQGQSPYVVNLQLGYDNFFTRTSAVFMYNVFGERITSLGILDAPDVYEQPFHKLDFVMKWGINDTYDEQVKKIGYTLAFKASNILDSEVEKTQGNNTIFSYSPGRAYSISLSMKF